MSIDVTFIISFVIVVIAGLYLKRALFDPVGQLLDARAAKLKSDDAERTRALAASEERILEYNNRLIAARKGAFDKREAERRLAMEERGRIMDAARDEAQAATAKGKSDIAAAAAAARTGLEHDAAIMAQAIAGRILGRPATTSN